jgi:SPP1 gp7 family putative phage head morphogenesis protein
MIPKSKIARAVHSNIGLEIKYRHRIEALIDSMSASIEYWIKAAYRSAPPRVAILAHDASPFIEAQRRFDALGKRWQERADELAPKIADAWLKDQFNASDSAMRMAFREAGWAVKFTMTPAVRDAFNASLAENVGLIRSIPAQYLQQVEGIVARSYSQGRDLQTMVKELRALYPKARNRATFIARDQSNKANAVVNRTRQLELGITEAVWLHSHAGKEPRPTHVAMNGKRFKIAEGMWDSAVGEFIQPGVLPNCRCVSRPILPFATI